MLAEEAALRIVAILAPNGDRGETMTFPKNGGRGERIN
jgi:hypothetical protein